jgi:hypothetical protein
MAKISSATPLEMCNLLAQRFMVDPSTTESSNKKESLDSFATRLVSQFSSIEIGVLIKLFELPAIQKLIQFKHDYVLSPYTHSPKGKKEFDSSYQLSLHSRFETFTNNPLSPRGFYNAIIDEKVVNQVFKDSGINNFVKNKWLASERRQTSLLQAALALPPKKLFAQLTFLEDNGLDVNTAFQKERALRETAEREELHCQFAHLFTPKEAASLARLFTKQVHAATTARYSDVWASFVIFHTKNPDLLWKNPLDINRNTVLKKVLNEEEGYMMDKVTLRIKEADPCRIHLKKQKKNKSHIPAYPSKVKKRVEFKGPVTKNLN